MTGSNNDFRLKIHRQEQVDFAFIYVYKQQADSEVRIATIEVDDNKNLEKRAELIEAVYEKTELSMKRMARLRTDTSTIVSMAAEGKPILAAYLYSFRGWDKERIATEMKVSTSTVDQYFSDIIHDRR